MKLLCLLVILPLAQIAPRAANALSDGLGSDPRPDTNIFAPSEVVDEIGTANGNLIIRNKELSLPGNGGLNIEVWRNYDMLSASSGLMSTHSQSYKWTALGPGWRIGAAPMLSTRNTSFPLQPSPPGNTAVNYVDSPVAALCNGSQTEGRFPQGLISLQLPNGQSEEPIVSEQYKAMTVSGWKVECLSNAIAAVSPSGVRYDLGNYSERRIGLYAASINDSNSVVNSSTNLPVLVQIPVFSDSYWVAKSAKDLSGNTLTYTYKQFGTAIAPWPNGKSALPGLLTDMSPSKFETPSLLLASISSSDGRAVNFNYDPSTGRLSSMVDNTGRTWSYSYLNPDSLNSRTLTKVILPTGLEWNYSYIPGVYDSGNKAGAVSTVTTASSRKLSQLKYPTGGTVTYAYGFYRLNGYMAAWVGAERVVNRTLSTGESWNYEYVRGNVGSYDQTKITGPEGVTMYKYMGPGYAVSANKGLTYVNNAWKIGSLISKTNPDGSTEDYSWQPRLISNRPTFFHELGWVADEKTWMPDLESRVIVRNGATYKTVFSNYDSYGNPGTRIETGPDGSTRTTQTTYLNDRNKWIIGLVKNETYEGGSLTKEYDANGRMLSETRDGITTSYTYDGEGNVASKTFPRGLVHSFSNYKRGKAQIETQPEGISITRVVDNSGNIVSETNGEGKTTAFAFDGLNRIISQTPPAGSVKTFAYTANTKTATRGALIETTQYEPFGQPASVTLGGVTRSYKYDGLGRQVFVSNPGSTVGTSYQYDGIGRVVRITNSDGTFQTISFGPATRSVTDERDKVTTYTYRSYGDPNEQHLMSIVLPEPGTNLVLTRNAKNQVTSVTQGGITRSYAFNSNYQLISSTNPESGTIQYGRDAAGNMISKTSANQAVSNYTYDGQNRIVAVTYSDQTPAVANTYNKTGKMLTSSSTGGSRSFSYDDVGNLTQDSLTVDSLVLNASYKYNGNDQLEAITYPRSGRVVNYTPDVLGRPTMASGYVDNVTYWPSGQIQQIKYSNGTVSSYGQNSRLWPSGFTTGTATQKYLDTSYSYDGVGNLTQISDTVDASYGRVMGYDNNNRLVSANGPWGIGAIAYDSVGNIKSQLFGDRGINYTYDGSNHLSAVSGLRSASYSYDLLGSAISGGNNTYTYDSVPNLTCINCSGTSPSIKYTYDGLNQRSSVDKSGFGKTYEMYDSAGKLLVDIGIGQPNRLIEYVYLGGKRIAQRVSP